MRSPHLSKQVKAQLTKILEYTVLNQEIILSSLPNSHPWSEPSLNLPQLQATLASTRRTTVNKHTDIQINHRYTTAASLAKLEVHCAPLCGDMYCTVQAGRTSLALSCTEAIWHFRTTARNYSTRRQRKFSAVFMQKHLVDNALAWSLLKIFLA